MNFMNEIVTRIIDESFPDSTSESVEQFDGGETHEVVSVDFTERNPVVVKYTDGGEDRLYRDRATLRYVAENTSVPVPMVFDWGEEPAYLVMEAVPGETTPQLRDFETDGATDYIRTAGELLGRLHAETEFESVGHIEGATDSTLVYKPADSWPEFFSKLKRDTASELQGTRFEEAAGDAVAALPETTGGFAVDRPVLAHCDFGPNNVFRFDGDVTGVIDWEWTLAADPAYDLLRAERLFRTGADDGTRNALLTGYRTVRPVPDDYEHRAEIYSAYETLSPMSSFESWCPDDEEKAQELADSLREAVYERLP